MKVPYEINGVHGGTQLYRFENGYGASVVRHTYSYDSADGKWELAVLQFGRAGYKLTYETPITDDVLGHLSDEQVEEILTKIEALPALQPEVKT